MLTAIFVCTTFALARDAAAGPPLVCHPFISGSSPLLPWGDAKDWLATAPGYDVGRLTEDTLRLLTPDAPVLARMENMRRAVIYAAHDRRAAADLLAAVLTRALTVAADGRADRMAWFDAGYLIETVRQAHHAFEWNMLSPAERAAWTLGRPPDVGGYLFVRRAMSIGSPSAEMEFAASLMTEGATSRAHRVRATGAAPEGSLLARNLQQLESPQAP